MKRTTSVDVPPTSVPESLALTGVRLNNPAGAAWLIIDMCLNLSALALVKSLGADWPAVQLVFLRASVGLLLVLPWAWRERHVFGRLDRPALHLSRVLLAVVTLAASFHAVARLPLALFTAVNFTRPLLLMAMAVLLLGERIGPRRWAAGALGLAGVLIALNPGNVAWTPALAVLALAVFAGCASIIVTRRLIEAPAVVLMSVYAGGLTLVSAPFALLLWQPIGSAQLPMLLGIGVLTQCAQFCFLRAHALGEVGVLAPLGYLVLFLSAAIGWIGFGEVPGTATVVGSAVILIAAALVRRRRRSIPGTDRS